MPEKEAIRNEDITTCSEDDGEVPGGSVDFVHQEARDSRTFNAINNGHAEVIAESSIRKLSEWAVVLKRVKRAAPIVGGLVIAGTLTYEVWKHLKQEKEQEAERKRRESR